MRKPTFCAKKGAGTPFTGLDPFCQIERETRKSQGLGSTHWIGAFVKLSKRNQPSLTCLLSLSL